MAMGMVIMMVMMRMGDGAVGAMRMIVMVRIGRERFRGRFAEQVDKCAVTSDVRWLA